MSVRRLDWVLVLAVSLPVPGADLRHDLKAATVNVGQRQGAANAKIVAGFVDRVRQYVALRQKLQATAPSLPKQATPEQIDQHQRALAALIQSSRAGAKPGDLFGTDMTAEMRLALKPVFAGPEGAKRRSQILEEDPGPTPITVNGRYPDRVPLSNMPLPVLEALPKLPDEIEYRFVGDQLILFDARAHIVVDFIGKALPGA